MRHAIKVPNGLSRCHTKKGTGVHGRAHPSFGMTLTLKKKNEKRKKERKKKKEEKF